MELSISKMIVMCRLESKHLAETELQFIILSISDTLEYGLVPARTSFLIFFTVQS